MNKRLSLSVVVIALIVMGGCILYAVSQQGAPTPRVELIPAASTYRAPSTGGGPVWGGSAWAPSPFRRAQLHHPWCGRRISPQRRGIHGIYRMWFQHCAMAFGPIQVYARATPRPTRIPLPAASAVPGKTLPVPSPSLQPTPVPPPSNDPATFELSLMNQSRASLGLPPYSLDTLQSNGTATCGGSIGHSRDMAASGTIWHVNAAYPAESFPNNFCGSGYRALGENVGMSGGRAIDDGLSVIHQSMMSEPHDNCAAEQNHACNVLSGTYSRVGIGVFMQGSTVWLTVDFIG